MNFNSIIHLNFSEISDDVNWIHDSSSTVVTSEGKLKLNLGSSTSTFDRIIGNVNTANNRIGLKCNFQIEKTIGSSPFEVEFDFVIKKTTGEILYTTKVYLDEILDGQLYNYYIDRVFKYDAPLGSIKLSIISPIGWDNTLKISNLEVFDFNFCPEKIRTYFVMDNILEETKNFNPITKAGIELLEWKVDNVETLTTAYFNENNIVVGGPTTNWKFAKANLDGTNRIAELTNPTTFNPFVQEFGLLFDAVNYFSGKPTGTVSGSDYGTGILEIGTDKPIILNGSLQEKKGAFFIDIDYTKNLKIRFKIIVNKTQENIFELPNIYREYTIEWNAETCTKSFFYKDLTQAGEGFVDQLINGFLSGVTPFLSEEIQTNVGNFTEIVWNDTNTTENRSGGSATETIYFGGSNYPTNSIIWQRANGSSFVDDSTAVNVTGTFNLFSGINEFRLKGFDNFGNVVYSNILRYTKINLTPPLNKSISFPLINENLINICIESNGDGGSEIIECGVVYNTTGNPTINDFKILYDNTIEKQCKDFYRPVSGQLYFFAAYYINEIGISYLSHPYKK